MGDIDFDELDKAVNSIMSNGVVADAATSGVPQEKPVNTLSLKDDSKTAPTPQQIEQAAKKIGGNSIPETDTVRSVNLGDGDPRSQVAPSGLASSQKPVGGRFMDVMHPSSDMRNIPAPRPETRPTQSAVPPRSANIDDTSINTAPDPEETPQAPASEPVNNTIDPAGYSPFIPDAKVEKRPLGGAIAPGATSGAVPSPFNDISVGDKAAAPQNQVPNNMPEPSQGLTESKVDTADAVPNSGAINGEQAVTENQDDNQKPVDPTAPSTQEAELAKLESNESLAPEAPSAMDVQSVESGDTEKVKSDMANKAKDAKEPGIYDVDAHHKSIKHPPKQRSGWLVIVAIVVVILVFAGLGVAAFFILGPGL